MIQLVATDIDGTLLDKDRSLSDRTLKAFKKLSQIPVILISARMPQAMYYLQELLERVEMPVICYNGALIKDQQHELYSITIDCFLLEQLAQIAVQYELHMSVYRNNEWFVPSLDFWAKREINNTRVQPIVQELSDTLIYFKNTLAAGGAHKVMFMGDAVAMNLAFAKAQSLQSSLHLYRSKDTYTEISPKNISKKTALEFLLNKKFPSIDMVNVAAFGDNYNDVEMIDAVGYGVAVANARDEVKKVAQFITSHHKEDGVALWIENHI